MSTLHENVPLALLIEAIAVLGPEMHSLLRTQNLPIVLCLGVDFQADGTCAIAFTYIWTNDDPIHVAQEFVGRKLLYAQVPLSFPVELYSIVLTLGMTPSYQFGSNAYRTSSTTILAP